MIVSFRPVRQLIRLSIVCDGIRAHILRSIDARGLVHFSSHSPKNDRTQQHIKKLIWTEVAAKLSCDVKDAYRIFDGNAKTRHIGPDEVAERIQCLLDLRISPASIMQCPAAVIGDNDTAYAKIHIINRIRSSDLNDYVPMLQIPLKMLNKTEEVWQRNIAEHNLNRVKYFSEQLEAEPFEVCNRLCSTPTLLTKPFHMMVQTLETIRGYGCFDSESILRSFRAFNHSQSYIVQRIDEVLARDVTPRMWMIFASHKDMEQIYKIRSEEKLALAGHQDRIEFFRAKLNLDDEGVRKLFLCNERLYNCKIRRVTHDADVPTAQTHPMTAIKFYLYLQVSKVIDYLLDKTAYTVQDIARSAYVLNYSLAAIQERLEYFKSHGILDRPLHLLFT